MDIKAMLEMEIEANRPMACHDVHAAMDNIDFNALSRATIDDRDTAGYSIEGDVATIKVHGLLTSHMRHDMSDWGITGYNHIIDYLAAANDNPLVKSIVLDVDSGGGTVNGVEQAAEAVRNSAKPVEGFTASVAYSAAYWLMSNAKTITATAGAKLGSIGTIATHYDRSQSLTMRGIQPTVIRSGEWKGAFSSIEPLTDKHKARITEMVAASSNVFFNAVAAGRGLSVDTVASWGGDTFTAARSRDIGLVDTISDKPSTLTTTNNLANAKGDNMELNDALAEITRLKAENAEKDVTIAAAAKEKRDGMIAALETSCGKTFTDEEKTSLGAMDEAAFKITASLTSKVTPAENKDVTPAAAAFPSVLLNAQALHGRDVELQAGGGIDASFAAAKQRNLKK